MDSDQQEINMKIYLHGNIESIYYQSLFYNSIIKDEIYAYSYFKNTHELGNKKDSLSQAKIEELEKKYEIVIDFNYEKIDEIGKHIIDDVNKIHFNRLNPNSKYYFIQFSNCEGLGLIEDKDIKLGENIFIFSSGNPNSIVDFGHILRTNFFSRLLSTSFYSSDLFKNTKKNFRIDYSIRNFLDKNERIDMFYKLLKIKNSFLSLSVNSFFVNKFKAVYPFFENPQIFSNELNFVNFLNEELIENDELNDTPYTFGNHNHQTKLKKTLSSDISIIFESSSNELYLNNRFRNGYISEKILDNLLIGKPFIIGSMVAYSFLKRMGLDDYSEIFEIDYEDVFSDIETVNKKLIMHIEKILNMDISNYKILLQRLEIASNTNREKCLESFEKNSILDKIINDKL